MTISVLYSISLWFPIFMTQCANVILTLAQVFACLVVSEVKSVCKVEMLVRTDWGTETVVDLLSRDVTLVCKSSISLYHWSIILWAHWNTRPPTPIIPSTTEKTRYWNLKKYVSSNTKGNATKILTKGDLWLSYFRQSSCG